MNLDNNCAIDEERILKEVNNLQAMVLSAELGDNRKHTLSSILDAAIMAIYMDRPGFNLSEFCLNN